jgi:hypothetical protein
MNYLYINLTIQSTHSSGSCLSRQRFCQYRIRTVRQKLDGWIMSACTTFKSRWRLIEKIGLNTCGFVRSWYPIHSSLSLIQKARPEFTNGWFWMLRTRWLSRRLSTPTTECLSWLKQLEPQFLDKYSFLYSMTFMLPNLFMPICSIIGKNLNIRNSYRNTDARQHLKKVLGKI